MSALSDLICEMDGCDQPAYVRQRCVRHYLEQLVGEQP